MSRQYFADVPFNDVAIADLTAVTATTETGLWTVARYSPIPAFDPRAGKVYLLEAGGIWSTGASGTLTITPRIGTSTGGVTCGASVAQTTPINLTNEAWTLRALLTIRTIGDSGGTSSCMLTGMFNGGGAAATIASSCVVTFGGTAVTTADFTTAQGIFIGWTLSVAGSNTPKNVAMFSLN